MPEEFLGEDFLGADFDPDLDEGKEEHGIAF